MPAQGLGGRERVQAVPGDGEPRLRLLVAPLGERLEGVLDEVEEPVKDLAPGLRRLARMLDDPAVSEVPETVRRIREDLLPLFATLRGGVDVFDRFSGRALLGGVRRRPEVPPVTPPAIPPALDEPPAEAGA